MWNDLNSQFNNFHVFNNLFSLKNIANLFSNHPLTINMLITSNCNLKCGICSAKGLMNNNDQLSSQQIKGFIKKIKIFSPVFFIGGGEPFMREDIFEVMAEIKNNNLRYGIVTNGILLDKKKIDRLLTFAPQVMIFSVHGTREFHDKMVGQEGAFDILCANIRYLNGSRRDMRLILNCVINEENYNRLEEMVDLGNDLGVDLVRFEHLIFLNKKEYEKHLAVCSKTFSVEQCGLTTYIKDINNSEVGEGLKKIIPYLQKKYRGFVVFKPHLNSQELTSWYKSGFYFKRKCFFVRHSVFIKPNGDIVPCQFFSDFVFGNIVEDDFIQGWRSKKRGEFNKLLKKRLLPGCMRCCKL